MITHITDSLANLEHDSVPTHAVDEQLDDFVHLFKLLADDTRMRVLLYLSRQPEMHVQALCQQLKQSQPAVSHHLALLRVAGLIDMRREGRHNFYRLRRERFQEMLALLSSLLQGHKGRALKNGRELEYVTF